jgi:hypothetical protein
MTDLPHILAIASAPLIGNAAGGDDKLLELVGTIVMLIITYLIGRRKKS